MCLCKHRKKSNNRILDRTDKEELVNMTVFSKYCKYLAKTKKT